MVECSLSLDSTVECCRKGVVCCLSFCWWNFVRAFHERATTTANHNHNCLLLLPCHSRLLLCRHLALSLTLLPLSTSAGDGSPAATDGTASWQRR